MARTDKQEIAYAHQILSQWNSGDGIAEIEFAFTLLDDVNINKYPDEIKEIRTALQKNEDLNASYIKRQLHIPQLARKGLLWYDPAEWY